MATVIKRLQDHKTRLENHFDTGGLEGRIVDLKPKQEDKAKKAESI